MEDFIKDLKYIDSFDENDDTNSNNNNDTIEINKCLKDNLTNSVSISFVSINHLCLCFYVFYLKEIFLYVLFVHLITYYKFLML